MQRIITQKDLADNPILKELGIKLGWVVSVAKDEVSLGKTNDHAQATEGGEQQSADGDGEGENGSNNPSHKPPFTPPNP